MIVGIVWTTAGRLFCQPVFLLVVSRCLFAPCGSLSAVSRSAVSDITSLKPHSLDDVFSSGFCSLDNNQDFSHLYFLFASYPLEVDSSLVIITLDPAQNSYNVRRNKS